MKVADEDTSKVYVRDLPEQEEYSDIIYAAQEAGRLVQTNFQGCQEANNRAWSGIMRLMAGCIARGMRLQREASPTHNTGE